MRELVEHVSGMVPGSVPRPVQQFIRKACLQHFCSRHPLHGAAACVQHLLFPLSRGSRLQGAGVLFGDTTLAADRLLQALSASVATTRLSGGAASQTPFPRNPTERRAPRHANIGATRDGAQRRSISIRCADPFYESLARRAAMSAAHATCVHLLSCAPRWKPLLVTRCKKGVFKKKSQQGILDTQGRLGGQKLPSRLNEEEATPPQRPVGLASSTVHLLTRMPRPQAVHQTLR